MTDFQTPPVAASGSYSYTVKAASKGKTVTKTLHLSAGAPNEFDLRSDLRRACRLLLQARGILPGTPSTVPSQVQVVTPYNEPAALGPEPDD